MEAIVPRTLDDALNAALLEDVVMLKWHASQSPKHVNIKDAWQHQDLHLYFPQSLDATHIALVDVAEERLMPSPMLVLVWHRRPRRPAHAPLLAI
eukprot:56954-Amphidinium_carterae.1